MSDTPKHYWPLGQLILARAREFYREPEAIFWVYGFPLILAVCLGMAFSQGETDPPQVDVQGQVGDQRAQVLVTALREANLKVSLQAPAPSVARFKSGKTSLVVVPQP